MRRINFPTTNPASRGEIAALVAVFVVAWALMPGQASSHREAPLIAQDPMADNTDVYAWRNADEPDKVTLIANFIPFQKPDGGPNFYRSIPTWSTRSTSTTTAMRSRTSPSSGGSRPRSAIPATFLYNTGAVTSLDDPDLNVRQFYRLTRIDGPRRTGTVTELSGRLPVPPPNIGPRSTPNYGAHRRRHPAAAGQYPRVRRASATKASTSISRMFDLLGVGAGMSEDSTAGFNVSTLAIQMPIGALTRSGTAPTSASDPNAIIGVWSTASRFATRTLTAGAQTHSGRARAGVAARQPARQRGGDRSRAQGRVQRHRADRATPWRSIA